MRVVFSGSRPMDGNKNIEDISVQSRGEWTDISSYKLIGENSDPSHVYLYYRGSRSVPFGRSELMYDEAAQFIAHHIRERDNAS
jgi:hypothetical protein